MARPPCRSPVSSSSRSGLLLDHIDRAARDLERTATGSTKKLEEAGSKFSKHLETANSFLANQLSSTAEAIDERLEGISMQFTGKLETAGSRISERLEDVSGVVQKSLDKFNVDMERMLTSREDTLGGLVESLGKRAQDVDAMMRNYMALIEESLGSAERRSAEVGKFVAENSAQIAANLEKEIRKLEASSDTQISNAARVMREQHERAIGQMNQMMAETASGFQQTAQDMRVTAQQVVKDIEFARNELKRAIFDLPDETRANADAMRQVVADQISALNALADVVKRQSSALDLSGPGIYMPSGRGDPARENRRRRVRRSATQDLRRREETNGTERRTSRKCRCAAVSKMSRRPSRAVRAMSRQALPMAASPSRSAQLLAQPDARGRDAPAQAQWRRPRSRRGDRYRVAARSREAVHRGRG